MINITRKFLICILSFICLTTLCSCNTVEEASLSPQKREPVEIAILMPIGGSQAYLGQQYNELIKMGLKDGVKTRINVTSYDGTDEKQVLASIEKIIKRKTKIILGPVYSPLASLIAKKAKENDIIIITMSNNPVLADENLFVFGHAPLKQLERLVSFFLDKNYRYFIALLPVGQNSIQTNKIIQDMVVRGNAAFVRQQFYGKAPEDIDKSVRIISDAVDNINENDQDSAKPVVYLSGDQQELSLVFSSILKYNLDKKAVIIGDNRIDIDHPANVDITFTGSLNIVNSNIGERAKELGVTHLSFMHAMAYDLGNMTANYMGEEFSQAKFLARINSHEPYMGVSGDIFFIDSIAQRKYDIIKREDGVYKTIED